MQIHLAKGVNIVGVYRKGQDEKSIKNEALYMNLNNVINETVC